MSAADAAVFSPGGRFRRWSLRSREARQGNSIPVMLLAFASLPPAERTGGGLSGPASRGSLVRCRSLFVGRAGLLFEEG